ncbi:MAG: isoprenylcysteine carboxylmethyltransferase family protein, partial [Pseudomonadota bacterium]
ITFWLVIHSLSDLWRMANPRHAYLAAGACIAAVIFLSNNFQSELLGKNLGFNWMLFAVGCVIYFASWILWKPVKRYLNFKTFAGLPEVTDTKIELITDGPFSMVRHPRYLMVTIGVVGWCIMANYAGVYVVGFASIIGLVAIVNLEERDLVKRFGDEYLQYQKAVPQLFPTLSGIRRFIASLKEV